MSSKNGNAQSVVTQSKNDNYLSKIQTPKNLYISHFIINHEQKGVATTNNITKVPEEEKNAFYSARLSLVHNTRIEPYENTEDFEKDIVEEEGEKIISWIINMPEKECKYESKFTVEEEWEYLASPELEYMEKFWTYSDGAEPINVMRIVRDFQEKYQIKIPSVKAFLETLADKGYYINRNAIHDIIQVPQKEIPEEQKKI